MENPLPVLKLPVSKFISGLDLFNFFLLVVRMSPRKNRRSPRKNSHKKGSTSGSNVPGRKSGPRKLPRPRTPTPTVRFPDSKFASPRKRSASHVGAMAESPDDFLDINVGSPSKKFEFCNKNNNKTI